MGRAVALALALESDETNALWAVPAAMALGSGLGYAFSVVNTADTDEEATAIRPWCTKARRDPFILPSVGDNNETFTGLTFTLPLR